MSSTSLTTAGGMEDSRLEAYIRLCNSLLKSDFDYVALISRKCGQGA
jgi:hypothetical protein